MDYLYVTNAEYVDGLALRIWFNDHTVRLVDFADFLSKHPHPQYDKYLDEAELVLLLNNLATLLANYTDNIFSSIEEKISQMKEKPPRTNPELIEIFKKIIDYCTYIN